jgi:hypothetical protein
MAHHDAAALPDNWERTGPVSAWWLGRVLRNELRVGHKMHGKKWTAVARDRQSDDVLFADDGGGVAKVHLTHNRPATADFPSCAFFDDLQDFLAWAEEERQFVAALANEVEAVCAACGSVWSRGEARQDCPICDGYALARPCPICSGSCEGVWQRAIQDSNDFGHAVWIGKCAL